MEVNLGRNTYQRTACVADKGSPKPRSQGLEYRVECRAEHRVEYRLESKASPAYCFHYNSQTEWGVVSIMELCVAVGSSTTACWYVWLRAIYVYVYIWIDNQKDTQTDRRTDGRTDGPTYRQTDR